MSGLVVTFAMMETEKSDLIMQNFSRRRRNALGNIFKDVDHEELYEKLMKELEISGCGGTESNPGSPDSTKTVENKSNRFGWVITTLHYIDEEKKTKKQSNPTKNVFDLYWWNRRAEITLYTEYKQSERRMKVLTCVFSKVTEFHDW